MPSKRVQFRLPEHVYDALLAEAKETGKSADQVAKNFFFEGYNCEHYELTKKVLKVAIKIMVLQESSVLSALGDETLQGIAEVFNEASSNEREILTSLGIDV